MPRYYFDLPDAIDQLGSELPDDATARSLARRYAGELLRDGRSTVEQEYWRMDVRREEGDLVLFSLVLELLPGRAARRDGSRPPGRMHLVGRDHV